MSEIQPLGQPPPTYAPSRPQILVAPLPDATSFFWGRTVQGEVFVKGLGDGVDRRSVKALLIQLQLSDRTPDQPLLQLYQGSHQTLWPIAFPTNQVSSSSQNQPTSSFPSSHRFTIHLPEQIPARSTYSSGSQTGVSLPGTLDLSDYGKGEVRWSLAVTLQLQSEEIEEVIRVEGTPQDLELPDSTVPSTEEAAHEVEIVVNKAGVASRLLVDDAQPRLGSLLRLGVEVRPKERQRTPVAGLASQPDPGIALRALRRVRVELYRLVYISTQESSIASSSSAQQSSTDNLREHLTLLHSSGKSLRYPGANNPPLRVLFTLPTAQLGSVADQTWGEISMRTPYHHVTFFVRATFGFGALAEEAPESVRDWVLEQKIEIRPKIWKEPRHVVLERGLIPDIGLTEGSGGEMTDEAMARELYRLKGMDIVGQGGTYRASEGDNPPDFSEAGPSNAETPASDSGVPRPSGGGLPSFLESEAQAASGVVPLPRELVPSERLVPVEYEDDSGMSSEDRATTVGRRGSLKGELGTWIEYDGYETFSVAPPSAAVSYGASGSMDPPQPDEEDSNVASGMAARLGLGQGRGSVGGMELMEQLGLGEGTRIIDMQDDLPPGIDEPSLPALPTFNQSTQYNPHRYRPVPHPNHPIEPSTDTSTPGETVIHDVSPPSFAASEAAQAVGGMADPGIVRTQLRRPSMHVTLTAPMESHATPVAREDPPGYFGAGSGGPPAYS